MLKVLSTQKDWQMGTAFVIICLVFSEVIDGYLLKTPRDTVALLGDRVELDCFTNSSRTLDWHFTRHGSAHDEWISSGNEKRPNTSDAFMILSKEVGQFALVIDPVLTSHAGRYECDDGDEVKPFSAEVTLLNRTPSCAESTVSPSREIVCSFGYTGNLKLELEWMTLEKTYWNASCHASNDTVECVFESYCTANKLSLNANTFQTMCIGENNTCKWGNASSSVGLLQIKGHNKTVGSWHCTSTGVTTTTQPSLQKDSSEIHTTVLLLICVGVTSTAIILLLFILHKKYGICRKNRFTTDVLYDRTMDQEVPVQTQTETRGSVNITSIYSLVRNIGESGSTPVYAQVQKKSLQKKSVNAHDNVIIENSIYASSKPSDEAKTVSEVPTNNFATDDIIYAELGQVPRDNSSRIQGAPMVFREGFNTSTYASIDHNLRAPALPPQLPSHHRHPN